MTAPDDPRVFRVEALARLFPEALNDGVLDTDMLKVIVDSEMTCPRVPKAVEGQPSIATLVHELRNSMSTTLSWARCVQRRPSDVGVLTAGAAAAEAAVRRQAALLDELLIAVGWSPPARPREEY